MPVLTASESQFCERRCGECLLCHARWALTSEDWYALGFYRRVRDQVVNHAPMGTDSGKPWIDLRLEGVEAALRIYAYPRREWTWLVESARLIHRLVTGADEVPASELRAVTLEAVASG